MRPTTFRPIGREVPANDAVNAPIHAAMRADELLDQGDMDGKVVWLRILAAVKELLAEEPEGTVH